MRILSLFLSLLLCSGAAWAQPANDQPAQPAEEAQPVEVNEEASDSSQEGWTVTVTPVMWLATTKTDISVGDRSRNLTLDAADALGNLEAGLMGRLEANNGQWGAFADLFFIQMGDDTQVGPRGNIPVSTEVSNTIWQLAGTYRVVNKEDFDLDLLAGMRGYSIDTDITIEPFTGPAGLLQRPGRFASADLSFVDPILGAKAKWRLSERWDLDLYGDIGGFGAGSDFTWRAGANFGYAASDSISLRAGYIVMDFDYSKGSGFDEVRYRTTMYGPVLGAGFKF